MDARIHLSQTEIRKWVEDEQRTLKWVAEQRGCCVSTIQAYCRDHGIKPKMGVAAQKWPVEKIRKWVEVDGHTHSWVGQRVGCRHQTVSKICKKNGITTQRSGPRSGAGHPEWKGGRILVSGYWYIYSPDHPNTTKQNRVAEHRLVMEKKLGRYLKPGEVVHHFDHDRQNNDPDNLVLYASNGQHLSEELKGRYRGQPVPQQKANHEKSALYDGQPTQE